MSDLLAFIAALAVAYLVPGPDMILVMQTSASQGRAAALATALGLAVARAAHVALAGLGLAALLRTAPMIFDLVRLAGAVYLIWLGLAIVRAGSLVPGVGASSTARTTSRLLGAARRGLITNISNPKALLFCSVLLPQFVTPEAGGMALQFLALGTILVVLGTVFDLGFAFMGAAIGRWLEPRPVAQAMQRWAFGAILIGFGLRLALVPRLA